MHSGESDLNFSILIHLDKQTHLFFFFTKNVDLSFDSVFSFQLVRIRMYIQLSSTCSSLRKPSHIVQHRPNYAVLRGPPYRMLSHTSRPVTVLHLVTPGDLGYPITRHRYERRVTKSVTRHGAVTPISSSLLFSAGPGALFLRHSVTVE